MARSTTAPRKLDREPRHARASTARLPGRQLPGVKLVLFGLVLLSLVGFVAVALTRELAGGNQAASRSANRPAVPTARPALTAEEERYALDLWPIHNDVKASALKMTLAGINYKTQRADVAALKDQIDASLATYRQAEGQILGLRPPASFQGVHDEYLEAVRLYLRAGAEMARVYDDRRDEHLLEAFPMSQEAGRKLGKVGAVLWPGEYVPN